MFGPKRYPGEIGPSFQEGSVMLKTGPSWTQARIHSAGCVSHCGTTVPPNIEKDRWELAAQRIAYTQSGRGTASSSVNTTKSPSAVASPALSAAFFPRDDSKRYVSGRRSIK